MPANINAVAAPAARAAAILTTAEVAGTSFPLTNAQDNCVSVESDFTIGSLTNVILRFYVSNDNSTFIPLEDTAGGVSRTLTATGKRSFTLRAPGWNWFRVSAQGTGTVTSSSLALNYRFIKFGNG